MAAERETITVCAVCSETGKEQYVRARANVTNFMVEHFDDPNHDEALDEKWPNLTPDEAGAAANIRSRYPSSVLRTLEVLSSALAFAKWPQIGVLYG